MSIKGVRKVYFSCLNGTQKVEGLDPGGGASPTKIVWSNPPGGFLLSPLLLSRSKHCHFILCRYDGRYEENSGDDWCSGDGGA